MEIVIYVMLFAIGTTIGSFLSLAVYRIPKKEDITHKHSYCPNCNHKLSFLDLIPILSYLFLKGKCRYCDKKIRIRYLLLEMSSGVIFLLFALSFKIDLFNIQLSSVIALIFGTIYIVTLLLIGGIDKEKFNIEKSLIIFGIINMSIYMIYLYIVEGTNVYRYIMYLVLICILILIETFLLKKKKKDSYTIQILILSIYITAFVARDLFVLTIILSLIFIAIDRIVNRRKKDKIQNIPVGFYLCISNVILLIAENFLIR